MKKDKNCWSLTSKTTNKSNNYNYHNNNNYYNNNSYAVLLTIVIPVEDNNGDCSLHCQSKWYFRLTKADLWLSQATIAKTVALFQASEQQENMYDDHDH